MVRKSATPEQKAKAAAYQQKWRAANPEKWKTIAGLSRKKWKANNRDEHREIQRKHRYTIRAEILALISGGAVACKHCGFSDWRALQIDHVNGGGMYDRDTLAGLTNLWTFRRKLRDPEYLIAARLKYQILCANCNWIKRHEKKELPSGDVIIARMRKGKETP
jgi:hypothetical protein